MRSLIFYLVENSVNNSPNLSSLLADSVKCHAAFALLVGAG